MSLAALRCQARRKEQHCYTRHGDVPGNDTVVLIPAEWAHHHKDPGVKEKDPYDREPSRDVKEEPKSEGDLNEGGIGFDNALWGLWNPPWQE